MRTELITVEELMGQLREQGVEDLAKVKRAFMAGDGKISVVEDDESNETPGTWWAPILPDVAGTFSQEPTMSDKKHDDASKADNAERHNPSAPPATGTGTEKGGKPHVNASGATEIVPGPEDAHAPADKKGK